MYILCNLALLGAAFISGLSFVAQKLGMAYVGPFTFNALRCFIGALSLLPLLFFMHGDKNKNFIKGGIISGIILFFAFSTNQIAMIYSDASKAGFITSLYILFVPLISVVFKHPLSNRIKLCVLASIFGLYLLCVQNWTEFSIWDFLLLISAFFFAIHIMTVSYYSKRQSAIKLSLVQFLIAGVLSSVLMFAFEEPKMELILAVWRPVLFIGVIVTAVAYTLQICGHKRTRAVLATLILSSEALFAVLGGVVLLGETLNLKEILGCIIMLFAIIFSRIPSIKKGETK